MKCPKCGGELRLTNDGRYACPYCKIVFKKKQSVKNDTNTSQSVPTIQTVQSADFPVSIPLEEVPSANLKKVESVQNNTSKDMTTASTSAESNNTTAEKTEIEMLKARLAEMEKKQSTLEQQAHDSKGTSQMMSAFKQTKFYSFMKKWGIKVIFPTTLVLVIAITLMVCLIGVRGIYVNVEDPNEFYSFTASKYQYYGESVGEEYVDSGTWKEKDGKMYLTYDDEDFGKQTDEYFFTKKDNDTIFIGEKKDSLKEYKRVQITKYNANLIGSVQIAFDYNGATGGTSTTLDKGQKLQTAPTPTRDGYVFKGWYTDKYGYKTEGALQLKEGMRMWEDTTYYANWWNGKTYALVLSNTDVELDLEEGDLILPILQQTERGYTYKYYFSSTGKLIDENTRMPAENVVIKREQISAKTIEITLEPVGGTVIGNSKVTLEYGKRDVKFPVCESEGASFVGYFVWDDNSSVVMVTSETGAINSDFWRYVYEDTTIRALWLIPDNFTDFNYKIKDGITITKYNGSATNVTIPQGTTRIDENTFSNKTTITSVTIPDSVTSIGNSAFNGCSGLTSIYYKGTIGSWCGISGLYNIMSSSRTLYIGGKKVAGDLVIPDSVTNVSDYAFYNCSEITSVMFGNKVKSIGRNAFNGCTGLTSIIIPDSVESIGDSTFYECSGLTSITIGNSVTSIGSSAFYNCKKLTTINFNGTKEQWNAISKDYSWKYNTGDYIVCCTDGTISKSES